jgi:hypothetical protein
MKANEREKSGSSAGYGLGRVERRHNDLIAAKERKEVKYPQITQITQISGLGRAGPRHKKEPTF